MGWGVWGRRRGLLCLVFLLGELRGHVLRCGVLGRGPQRWDGGLQPSVPTTYCG